MRPASPEREEQGFMFWVTSHPFDSAPAPLRARLSRDSLVKGETRDICMDKNHHP